MNSIDYMNKKFMKRLIWILREGVKFGHRAEQARIAFNIEEDYFNHLLMNKDFVWANHQAEAIVDSYRGTSFNNDTLNIRNRMRDVDNLLSVKKDILKSMNKEKYIIIEIIAIFTAIIWFLFSNITIFSNISSFDEAKKYLLLSWFMLFSFPILCHLILSDWKDKENQIKWGALYILFILLIFWIVFTNKSVIL